jgi:non-ribosomal peptide synthetase component E (peptide arylation enzyme)
VPYWLEEYGTSRPDLSSLAVLQVGGARLADDLARQVEPTLGTRLQQVYGMAEGLVSYTRLDDPEQLRCTTQGRPMSPADEMLVVDDTSRPVPTGQVGELLTRGPCTLRGYYRAAAHNAHAFTPDGFYRTGDLVRQLPSGHLSVVGRVKDQINRGGEKISAVEVEEHLIMHSAVRAAALVAMPHPQWGECAVAFIVCAGAPPTTRDLAAFLAARGLAGYKAPERVETVTSLPLTPVGKVDKAALARRLAS